MDLTLSERMIKYRALHNLTQAELGDLIGETANIIYRYENAKFNHHKKNILRIELKMNDLEKGEITNGR